MGDISTWTANQVILAAVAWGIVIGVAAIVGFGLLNIVEYLRHW